MLVFLVRRDGSYEMYEKVHVTPDEIKSWGLSGGKMVQTFDTDCAKIGILICYDVEFPELSRIMADQGMQILFVPFLTDTQNGYSRVRVCAQARAIENECFVVIAGAKVGQIIKRCSPKQKKIKRISLSMKENIYELFIGFSENFLLSLES